MCKFACACLFNVYSYVAPRTTKFAPKHKKSGRFVKAPAPVRSQIALEHFQIALLKANHLTGKA